MDSIELVTGPPKPRFPRPDDYREADRARARRQVDAVEQRAARQRYAATAAALRCTRCGSPGFVTNGYRCYGCGHSSGAR